MEYLSRNKTELVLLECMCLTLASGWGYLTPGPVHRERSALAYGNSPMISRLRVVALTL